MSRAAMPFVLSLALASSACTHAPDRAQGYGTPPPLIERTVDDVPVHGFKTWIRLDGGERLVGELLVAEPEGDVVVRTKKDGEQRRPFANVTRATVLTDRSVSGWLGGIGGMTGVLIASSLMTGFYIVILGPVVLGAGLISGGIAWAESRVVLRGDTLDFLPQYARWPQGEPTEPEFGEPIGPETDAAPTQVEPVESPAAAPIEPLPH